MTKATEPEVPKEPEVVEPEVFDELVDSGEFVEEADTSEGQVSPPNPPFVDDAPENGSVEPVAGEFSVPGNFEDEVAKLPSSEPVDGEDGEPVVLLPPDHFATIPGPTFIGPGDETIDPEIAEANKNAYKEAAEHAAKANSEA